MNTNYSSGRTVFLRFMRQKFVTGLTKDNQIIGSVDEERLSGHHDYRSDKCWLFALESFKVYTIPPIGLCILTYLYNTYLSYKIYSDHLYKATL